MKKWIIQTVLGLVGCLCFCGICSEPREDTPMSKWMVWELCWMGVLVIDIMAFSYCEKKGLIDIDDYDRE